MKVKVMNENGIDVSVVNSDEVLIKDVQSALDSIFTHEGFGGKLGE